jgi:hypothetical protein
MFGNKLYLSVYIYLFLNNNRQNHPSLVNVYISFLQNI